MTTSTTAQIAIISNVKPRTQRFADKLWREGNDGGRGFNPECDAELEDAGFCEHDESVMLVRKGKSLLAVGWCHGAWAVDVTGKIEID